MIVVDSSALVAILLDEPAADAYRRWGKGFHKASLNFGDCFAYALAEELACPLLYIGKDFPQTDIVSAMA